jgi:hypothetical protein
MLEVNIFMLIHYMLLLIINAFIENLIEFGEDLIFVIRILCAILDVFGIISWFRELIWNQMFVFFFIINQFFIFVVLFLASK